jgi:tetratricopeptide (TPR) repeat protein
MGVGVRLGALVLVGLAALSLQAPAQEQEENPLAARIHVAESAVASALGREDGVAWLRLAIDYQDAARYEDAERVYRQAIKLLKTKDRTMYATALDHMGTMYVERGQFAKAEPLERKALAIRQDENDAVAIGTSYMHLAMLIYGRHDLAGAEADAEMAASLLAPENAEKKASGATPEEQMTALIDLSLIRCGRGECAGAIRDLNRALRLAHANYQAESVAVGFIDFLLGYAHWKKGDAKDAAELMGRAIGEMEKDMGWGHPTYLAALKQYRILLNQLGRDSEAEEIGERIAKLEQASRPEEHEHVGSSLGISALR